MAKQLKNSFGILKKMFKELLQKTNFILFLPDVVVYCCMLHNLIFNGRDKDVESLMT
jgi:MFS-type transporter involved in bile tolerance (Atg22 family)